MSEGCKTCQSCGWSEYWARIRRPGLETRIPSFRTFKPQRAVVVRMPEGPACPICDAALFRRHCEYVCPNHGVVVDCGDPFTF